MKLEVTMVGHISLHVSERLSIAFLRPEKMSDIWRQLFKGPVRQAFIKSSMGCNLHPVGFAVTPEEVHGGHGVAAQKERCLAVKLLT